MKALWSILLTLALFCAVALLLVPVASASPTRSVQCGSSSCIDGSNFPSCSDANLGQRYFPGDGTGWVCDTRGWARFQ